MSYGTVQRRLQCMTCSVVAACLFRALKFLSRRDSHIREEARRWPEGKTLRMEVPGGASLTLMGTEAGFQKLSDEGEAHVTIRFKSPADAFRIFTGQISVAEAYAQHRFVLRGEMGLAMPFVRCVDIAEGYLFPAFLSRRILKRLPHKEVSTPRVYAAVLLGGR